MANAFFKANAKCLGAVRFVNSFRTQFNARQLHSESIISGAAQQVYKPKTIFRRPLDGLELMEHKYFKRNLRYSYRYAVFKSEVPLREEIVRQALVMVAQSQPLLRATVKADRNGMMYFECIHGRVYDNIDLSVMDRNIDDNVAVTEELVTMMDFDREDSPLWRVVLLREEFNKSTACYRNAIILILSHAIANASSSVVVYKQLLVYIDALTKGTTINPKDIPSFPLLPSSVTLLSHKLQTLQNPFSMNNLPESYVNPVLAHFPTIEPLEPSQSIPIDVDKPVSKILLRSIPNEQMKKLITQCRKHHCTLGGVLLTACHLAFCSLLKTKPLPRQLKNDIISAAAVTRDHYPALPSDYVSEHLSAVSFNLPLMAGYEDFWMVARLCTVKTKEDVNTGKYLEYLSVLAGHSEEMFNYRQDQAKLKLANRHRSGHALSNILLQLEIHPNNYFQLENLFGGGPSQGNYATFSNYIGTVNGTMTNLMTVYNGNVISGQVAKKYYDSIGTTLDYIISGENN